MQTVQIDISTHQAAQTLQAKQGDVGRKFRVILTDNGKAYSIPGGVQFSVWYAGPGGEGNYSAVGDRSAFEVEENMVTVELLAQMLTHDGTGMLCLVMQDAAGTQLGLWNLVYAVEPVPGMESQPAQQYYTALTEVAAQAIRAAETFKTDPGLSQAGKAADAAATGVALGGKAPGGYGLGGNGAYKKITTQAELDAVKANGTYALQLTDGLRISTLAHSYITMRVTAYNGECLMQEINPVDSTLVLRRFNKHGVWSEWEWDNPIMSAGVEYCTTERYNGKVVYAKLLDFGTLPNKSNKTIAIGATVTGVVSLEMIAATGSASVIFPWISVDGSIKATVYASTTTVVVQTFADVSGYSGKVRLKYTKD